MANKIKEVKKDSLGPKVKKYLVLSLMVNIAVNIGHPATPGLIEDKGLSDDIFGPLFAFMSIGFVFGAFLWGSLSDKFNRKLIAILPLGLFYGTGQLIVALSNDESTILFARILSGLGAAAFVGVGIPLIGDYTSKLNRSRAQTMNMAVATFGIGVGYVLGGFLSGAIDPKTTFIAQAIIVYAITFIGLFLITNVEKKATELSYFASLKTGLRNIKGQGFILFFVAMFPFLIVKGTLGKWIDVYVLNELGITAINLGWFVLVGASLTMIISIKYSRAIIKKFNDFKIIKVMLLVQSICVITGALLLHTTSSWVLVFVAAGLSSISTIAWTFSNGAIVSIVTKSFGKQSGTVAGVQLIVQQSGAILASFVAGGIAIATSYTFLFIMYGMLSVLALLLFLPQGKNYQD